jgi:prophage DNA circulation protein
VNNRRQSQLDRLEQKLDHLHGLLHRILKFEQKESEDMSAVSDAITTLTGKVTVLTSTVDGAEATLAGLKAALDKAIADAANSGATAAELQSLTDLSTAIDQQSSELAAAIAANTPSA